MKKIIFISFFVLFIFSILSSDIGRRPIPVDIKGELLPDKKTYNVGEIITLKVIITPTNIAYRGIDFENEKYFIINNYTADNYVKWYRASKKTENLAQVISNSINDSIIFLEDYNRNLILEIKARVIKETNYIVFNLPFYQYVDTNFEKRYLSKHQKGTEIKYNNSIIKGISRRNYSFSNFHLRFNKNNKVNRLPIPNCGSRDIEYPI